MAASPRVAPCPALRMVHEYVSPRVGLVERITAVRSRQLIARHTQYDVPVVDEGVLTRVYRFVPPPDRLIVVIMCRGVMRLGGDTPLMVRAGEAVLISGTEMSEARFEAADYLDVEWLPSGAKSPALPRRLRAPSQADRQAMVTALDSPALDPATILRRSAALCRALGAPVPRFSRGQFTAPTERDLEVARAIEQQFSYLSSRATSTLLAEAAGRSPRQMQRIVNDFNLRFGINATSWRDTRNRWRLQTATLLLSVSALSVAQVAAEVGYGSPNALARGFAKAGFSTPAKLRALVRPRGDVR